MILSQGLLFLIPLAVVNVASLIIFGFDKWRSVKGGWRVSELRLLLVAFIGPFGAFAGMLLFRHKTRKVKFLLIPIFLFAQIFFIAYFVL
ncbi:MAG: DUF1294 domain-containing protein [Candidatus Bathyarchaeota archaeon]|nr:DUF1294 domain-containing protein [Candidatus Bathyarchaeota archaeon]